MEAPMTERKTDLPQPRKLDENLTLKHLEKAIDRLPLDMRKLTTDPLEQALEEKHRKEREEKSKPQPAEKKPESEKRKN
jgi:hypothetical protein